MNTTKPITTFKLIWNHVATEEWQAGCMSSYYSIMQDGDRFTLTHCREDNRRVVATAHRLGAAQDAALIDWHKRTNS